MNQVFSPARTTAIFLTVMIVLAFVGQVAFVPAVAAQRAPSTEPAQDRVTTIRDNGAPAQSPQPPANTDNVIRDGGPAPSAAPPAPAPGPAAPPAEIGSPPDAPSSSGGPAAGFGPDDPSLFGWPASIGGRPLNIPAGSAGWTSPSTPLTRLDAGLDASLGAYSAIDGSMWNVDSGFSWDSVPTRPRDPALDILGTDDDALYLSQRRATLKTGAFGYQIAVPQPATYTARLHFAELWWGAPGGGPGAAGMRVFDVWAEEASVLVGYDIFASVGAMTATTVDVEVTVTDATLDLWFAASANVPAVAAIEIFPTASGAGQAMVDFAKQYLGAPYIWATSGPNSFDCSGFTNWVVSNVLGVSIGLNQVGQVAYGSAVVSDALQPGDLVFFQNTHPYLAGVSHVGMYIGNGQFIHASTGAGQVTINDLTWGYYADHYYGAVRLV